MNADTAPDAAPTTYAYKPSLMAPMWEFRLAPGAMEWRAGSRGGRAAYDKIQWLRLGYRPRSMQSYRFVTDIWTDGGDHIAIASGSWRSLVQVERFDAPYAAFVRELHRRIAAAGGTPVCEAGMAPWRYWPSLAIFVALSLAFAVLTVRSVAEGQNIAAALIGSFLALFLVQIGAMFKRNWPRRYRGEEIPADVLP